jgi:hypothetical protein
MQKIILVLLMLGTAPALCNESTPELPSMVEVVDAGDDIAWVSDPAIENVHVDPKSPKQYNRFQIAALALGARLYMCYHNTRKGVSKMWYCLWHCKHKRKTAKK